MFISSDTNIWIDFFEIDHPEHPFLLEHRYYISSAAFDDELIRSEKLRDVLHECGLLITEISDEEFILAQHFKNVYTKLSTYDAFALAIAKHRTWVLLTGDKPLRTAADHEDVECHGVIWVYDELRRQKRIDQNTFYAAIKALLKATLEGRCRLPITELLHRLEE